MSPDFLRLQSEWASSVYRFLFMVLICSVFMSLLTCSLKIIPPFPRVIGRHFYKTKRNPVVVERGGGEGRFSGR